ncbi:MAG: SDR family NAD(P)-dependent oxidoreductase [Parvibaculaceae bacterium]
MKAKQILLTGIGGCIGTAILGALRDTGAKVVGLAHEPGPDADLVADFADDRQIAAALAGVDGALDGIILSHGILEPGPIDRVAPARWRHVMDINVSSLYSIIHYALPVLVDGAAIVVVSSTAGFDHSPVGGPHYTASKWAVNGMVRHLAFDLGKRNIRINSICPGLVESPMGHALLSDSEYLASLSEIPLGRPAHAAEIADVALFLTGTKSTYVTGALVPVSGGYR